MMLDAAALLSSIGDLIGSFAWPAAFFSVVFVFRKNIPPLVEKLFERRINVKTPLGDMTFEASTEKLLDQAKIDGSIHSNEDPGGVLVATSSADDSIVDMQEPQTSTQLDLPNQQRLLMLSAEVQQQVFSLARNHGTQILHPSSSRPQVGVAIDALRNAELLSADTADLLKEFIGLSNRAAVEDNISERSYDNLIGTGIQLHQTLNHLLQDSGADHE